MNAKRTVVISDLHCGHKVGLTPPDWDSRPNTPDTGTRAWKLYRRRRKCYKFFADQIEALRPIDSLIVNGDCIDGKGPKSGGTELITTDRNEQAEMAVAIIDFIGAKTTVMSYGTDYHTGRGEDYEDQIAKAVDATISGHDWADVNGLLFDYRHYIGSSSIPHGRHTAIAKERLWNLLWAERDEYPKADVILRSHVHYHTFCGGPGWLAMTTPALQAYGSKIGTRKYSGLVDFGFVHFDVESKEDWTWHSHILRFRQLRRDIIKL